MCPRRPQPGAKAPGMHMPAVCTPPFCYLHLYIEGYKAPPTRRRGEHGLVVTAPEEVVVPDIFILLIQQVAYLQIHACLRG